LLDIAKIEAGKIEVRAADFDVDTMLSALRGMLRPLLVSDNIMLRFEIQSDMPRVCSDEGKVAQILRNFVSNALKFTERGEVVVTAGLEAAGANVIFSVTDTGIGIAEEDIERIFEEFTQIQGPLQSRVKGTGLGLPLCVKLAHLLGGKVTVTSEVGKGSTFSLVLPVQYGALLEEKARGAEASSGGQGIPVLVVDDGSKIDLAYKDVFRDSNYRLLPVPEVADIAGFLQQEPAAIVLDTQWAGEEGWRWLDIFKRDPATARNPVIVVGGVEDEERAYALGADACLYKPVDSAQMAQQLDLFTRGRVLVIEDDSATRYTIRKLLNGAAYHVIEAGNVGTGMRAVETMHPELIVLDLGLPDMPGERALDMLKNNPSTRAIPVIVATARDLSSSEHIELRSKAQAVLAKRNLVGDLLPAVNDLMGRAT
jgi:CheY-like chemotaxis protein